MTDQEIALVWEDLQPWLEASEEEITEAMRLLTEACSVSMTEWAEGMQRIASVLAELEST